MRKMRNNKGFSLVELIMVVLVMGVITAALSPQVMKWVGRARESADHQAADDLRAMAQIAVVDFGNANPGVDLQDENYIVTSSGVQIADNGADDNSGMKEILEDHMTGNYPIVQSEDGKVFQIEINGEGQKVTVSTVAGTY